MLDFTPPTTQQDRPATGQFALRDLLNGIFYYRRIALIVAGIVIAIGCAVALLMPPTYRAEARLLPLSAGIYDMQDAGGTPQPGQVLDPSAVVNVELQMLDSLELHRQVVRHQVGTQATPAQVNKALDKFDSHLHVTKASEANVIELTYTANDPVVAADALHELITRYFDSRANVLTAGRVTFLEEQRDRVRAQLDQANAQLTAFQQRNGIVNIEAQVAGAVAQDDLLRKNQLDTQASLADGRRSLSALRSAAQGVPSNIEVYSDNTEAARALGEMQTTLLALQAKRADLASRYMKGSPLVAQADKQIAALQATIRQQQGQLVTTRRTGRNQFYDSSRDRVTQAQATVEGETARSGTLAAQLAASGARLNKLQQVAQQLSAMTLNRDVLADSYKSLSTQVGQARIQLNQTTDAGSPSVRIIEAPTPPAKRSNPPLLLIAGSIVAAILISGTTVFVLGSLREVFLSPMEVERALGLPVLSAPLAGAGPSSVRREYSRLVGAIDVAGRGAPRAVLLLAPSSRLSLQQAALDLGRVIERRSPGRVILIRFAEDAPVPASAHDMTIEPFETMATGVIGIAACSLQRLDARLIAELKSGYDYIVVTAPPTTEGFESIELARAVDFVVPVIEAEVTRRPVARSMVTQLDDSGANAIGAILLGRRSHIPQWLYRLVIERRVRPA